MKIKDQLGNATKRKPINLKPDTSVREALNMMFDKNIGSVVVTNNDETIAGIVTERDMVIRVLGQNKNPDQTKLTDIMSTEILVANENDQVIDWLRVMSNDRFRHLPIVDENKKLISMMSQGDIVAFIWPDLHEKYKKDFKGHLGWSLQMCLILFAIITLILIAIKF